MTPAGLSKKDPRRTLFSTFTDVSRRPLCYFEQCDMAHIICPQGLRECTNSVWSSNEGRPPLKDPAMPLSYSPYVKAHKGVLLQCITQGPVSRLKHPPFPDSLIKTFLHLLYFNG